MRVLPIAPYYVIFGPLQRLLGCFHTLVGNHSDTVARKQCYLNLLTLVHCSQLPFKLLLLHSQLPFKSKVPVLLVMLMLSCGVAVLLFDASRVFYEGT